MKEFDKKKLYKAGEGHKKIVKQKETIKRIVPKGCYDYNDLPENWLFLDSDLDKKHIKIK